MQFARGGGLAAVLALLLSSCSLFASPPSANPLTAPPAATTTIGVARGGSGSSFELVLASNVAQTAAFTGNAVNTSGSRALLFVLDVTAASGTTPTLDVKIQTTEDGTNFCDVAAFAQATAVSRQLLRIVTDVVPSTPQVACTDNTLAAATVHQGPLGRAVRIKHALPGGTTPSFTYSVKAWVVD